MRLNSLFSSGCNCLPFHNSLPTTGRLCSPHTFFSFLLPRYSKAGFYLTFPTSWCLLNLQWALLFSSGLLRSMLLSNWMWYLSGDLSSPRIIFFRALLTAVVCNVFQNEICFLLQQRPTESFSQALITQWGRRWGDGKAKLEVTV